MWTNNRFPAFRLFPALLPVALMTIYPIAYALWTSLHSVMLLFPDEPFAGLDNYRRVLTSNYFQDALKNSLKLISIDEGSDVNSLGGILNFTMRYTHRGSGLHGTICGTNKAAHPVRRVRAISPARIQPREYG